MTIVVDTNRIIAALLKDSTTRAILFDDNFEFLTPDYTITEINEHKEQLKSYAALSDEEFDLLLALIFEHVALVPQSEYEGFAEGCKNDISDPDDVPILALAIATKADGIWAHDPHVKNRWSIDQRHPEVCECRWYYSGSYIPHSTTSHVDWWNARFQGAKESKSIH